MSERRTVLCVTGSRADFGLLLPVLRAIHEHPGLRLEIVATGTHLLAPARTVDEVHRAFENTQVAVREVVMQRSADSWTRAEDARALARGVEGVAGVVEQTHPDVVLVLGDRIEALAGALAANICGVCLAHIHGGDRAEGVHDESIRHAITKLAHVHFTASEQSRSRVCKMGEPVHRVYNTGSPALDGLDDIGPMGDVRYRELGEPRVVFLMHPSGLDAQVEGVVARLVLRALRTKQIHPVLALSPNFDPGREGILRAIEEEAGRKRALEAELVHAEHLERTEFVGLLKRIALTPAGFLSGNSSAGLIECAGLGVAVLNIGPRQDGRERWKNVVDLGIEQIMPRNAGEVSGEGVGRAVRRSHEAFEGAITRVQCLDLAGSGRSPFGDGGAGRRIAEALGDSRLEPRSASVLRKRNTY